MPNFHHYLLLNPPPAQDDMERAVSILNFQVPTSDGRQFIVSLLGQPHVVYCICVTIPNSDGKLSVDDLARVTKINSHMLSTLRVAYDHGADVVRIGDGFINACRITDQEFRTKLDILCSFPPNPDFRVNVENIKNTFNCGGQKQELIALVAEMGLPSLPMQYRFLALYKVLDLASGGVTGFSHVVRRLVDHREQEFQALQLSRRKFRNFIHEYRDKCAHIYTGNDRALGIVGLTSGDAEQVRKVLPLMRETVVEVIHTCFPNLGITFGVAQTVTDHPHGQLHNDATGEA